MANISTASGTCYIVASTEKECDKILSLIDRISDWQYSTWYDRKSAKKSILSDGRHQVEVSFKGFGCWEYANNISHMFIWLKEKLLKEERSFLKNTEFEIVYEYTDFEPGLRFLEYKEIRLTHPKELDLDWCPVDEEECEELPYKPFWLWNQGAYDSIDDVLEEECSWDEADEKEKEFLFEDFVEDYRESYGLPQEEIEKRVLKASELFRNLKGGAE